MVGDFSPQTPLSTPRHCERSEAIHDFQPHGLPRFARSDESKQLAPILVLAWGNLSRGDDALGPLCMAALRAQLPDASRVSQISGTQHTNLEPSSRAQRGDPCSPEVMGCRATLAMTADSWKDQIEFLEDYQLQIEHVLDLVGRQHVLFIDASLSCPAPFEVTPLQPAQDASFTTHALSPQTLLQIYQDMQGEPPPPCTLLAIRGEAFELGEPPSKTALANLEHALAWVHDWLYDAKKSKNPNLGLK